MSLLPENPFIWIWRGHFSSRGFRVSLDGLSESETNLSLHSRAKYPNTTYTI